MPGDRNEDPATDDAAPTAIEADLSTLEQLVARLTPGEPARIALWLARLEAVLARGGLQDAERTQLDDIVARLRELESQSSRLAAH
ncbi:hypothetical protein [Burkholderia gladioli]|uniref:hypothetical protein n=1 Tax=Burkholderia gladioli TaxID=28095 RepID=UPI000CFE8944|nr:hypothetical protein [Burkholderia gladioli]MBU9268986.1 hypothetical protein [Burkholderia gladioli]MBU9272193.1 hypothetical protein [Burkholderia gladioli]PRE24180.1 hypothetical protein C6P72_12815 [Burkholderia gladioli]